MNQDLAKTIESNLETLEMARQEIMSGVKSNCIKSAVIPFLILGGFLFGFRETLIPFFSRGNNNIVLYALIIVALVIILILTTVFYSRGRKKFEKIYKDVFVRPLMAELFPELAYNPETFVPEAHFKTSDLFTSDYSFYGGDDHFSGKIETTTVEFSELNVIKSNKRHSDTRSTSSNIFSGLFLHAELSETINNRILIDPLSLMFEKMQLPGFLMGMLKNFLPDYGKSVKTGVAKFDDNFKLYCEDEKEALRVITPELIDKIITVTEKLKVINDAKMSGDTDPQSLLENGVFLKISIIQNSMYFAVYGYKLFDIKFSKSVLDCKDDLKQSLSFINMMTDIAEMAS